MKPLSLQLQAGEILCLSGASGSGKSRLLRALADLDPSAGEILLDDQPLNRVLPHKWRQQVMLVPASPAWWHPSASEHFVRDMSEQAQTLGLGRGQLCAPVENLSTGESTRAALLRALARDPRILLLDEPTSALDAETTLACETLLQQWLTPERGIIWVSHSVEQIKRVAHRHLTLDHNGLTPA